MGCSHWSATLKLGVTHGEALAHLEVRGRQVLNTLGSLPNLRQGNGD